MTAAARAGLWRLSISLVAAGALAGLACDGSTEAPPGTSTAVPISVVTSAATSTVSAPSGERLSYIGGNTFEPEIVVAQGAVVSWTNHDDVPHTVAATDNEWYSDLLEFGDTYTRTFSEPGQFEYYCSVHPDMQGVVVVE